MVGLVAINNTLLFLGGGVYPLGLDGRESLLSDLTETVPVWLIFYGIWAAVLIVVYELMEKLATRDFLMERHVQV